MSLPDDHCCKEPTCKSLTELEYSSSGEQYCSVNKLLLHVQTCIQ